jgi:hypothetical protein
MRISDKSKTLKPNTFAYTMQVHKYKKEGLALRGASVCAWCYVLFIDENQNHKEVYRDIGDIDTVYSRSELYSFLLGERMNASRFSSHVLGNAIDVNNIKRLLHAPIRPTRGKK